MIRFIDLGDQTNTEETREFAFYDTVRDTFLELCGAELWVSVDELREAHALTEDPPFTLERLLRRIPEDWDSPKAPPTEDEIEDAASEVSEGIFGDDRMTTATLDRALAALSRLKEIALSHPELIPDT